MGDITIRVSEQSDRAALGRLAALDSRDALPGKALLGFQSGALVAAVPLDGGEPIADPFEYTSQVVDLLKLRAVQTVREAA